MSHQNNRVSLKIQVALGKALLEAIIFFFFFLLLLSLKNSVVCIQKSTGHILPGSLCGIFVLLFENFVYIGSGVKWLKPEIAMATCLSKRPSTWKPKAWVLVLTSSLLPLSFWTQILMFLNDVWPSLVGAWYYPPR